MAPSTPAYSQTAHGAGHVEHLEPWQLSTPDGDLDPAVLAATRRLGCATAWLALVIAGLGLLGGMAGSEPFGHLRMKPLVAVALVLCAAAMRLVQYSSTRVFARLGAALVTAIGVVALAEHIFLAEQPGRMVVTTAASFVLLGCSLLLWDSQRMRRLHFTDIAAVTVLALALLTLFTHAIQGSGVESLSPYADTSLSTALALGLLGAASLALRPEAGLMHLLASRRMGGSMLRRFLPLAVVLPPLLAWLAIEGVQRGWYADRVDAVLLALAVVAIASGAAIWSANSLNQADAARHRAEELLRASRDQWKLTFNCMSEGLSYHAPDYTILGANGSLLHLLGRENVAGIKCYKAVHGTDCPPDYCPMQRTLASGQTESGEFFEPALGRHMQVRTDPVLDANGRLIRVIHVVNDVTEKKQAEQAVRRLAAIVECTDDAVLSKDLNGHITSWNRAAERMYGYTAAEAIGQPVSMLCPPELQAEIETVLTKIRAGERIANRETRRVRRDGAPIDVSITISPLVDAGGQVVGASTIARDISERKRAEEQERLARRVIEAKSAEIARLNEELEERVRERTAELEASNRELEAFSYSVSHDLRAPLRSIDGFSHILLDEYTDRLDADGQHFLNRVRAASQQMGQLIDALLQLSRVTRADMHRERVDLSALARNILDQLQQTAPSRTLRARIAPGLHAMGDPRLLHIALQNLLGNAFKFTSRRECAEIELGSFEQEGSTVFFVRDNGAGFQMEYAHKLFGAFQRLHSVSEFEGTGIGLATVQRIVQRHGGRIWAEGAPDKGASFYFTFS